MPKNKNAVITGVGVQVGELSGVEIDSLRFALSILKKDTILNDANLDIEVIRGEAECSECNAIFALSSFGTCCPHCSSYFMKVLKGKELRVLNITVEEGWQS